ncbi:hypothetical protein [Dichotomicrobium thermohalophilum]|uniref:Uncharacterized protein n=1 Tax=Dichotomicrobium thermohalophilum TaxID=933063 RepID=A0A397Q7N6_9HYPH|nr:hypothetical protein [Dichotomicrobium thermohalophilum]RIA55517.1 hypothetical protein BXY53_0583 [Dichotomicrobium thermohalophilum]
MIWPAIRRIIAVVFAFTLACLTALIVLFAVGADWAARELAAHSNELADPREPPEEVFLRGIGFVAFFVTVAPTLSVLPGLVAVIVGEVAKIRAALYYIVAGGLAMIVMPLAYIVQNAPAEAVPSAQYLTIYATGGFAAGLVYWLIAGRNA